MDLNKSLGHGMGKCAHFSSNGVLWKVKVIPLIFLYLNVLIIIEGATKLIEDIKRKLSQVFEMKYIQQWQYCLVLDVCRENTKILITQSKYIKELLQMFNMDEFKAVCNPLQHNIILNNGGDIKVVDGTLYQ